MPKIKKDLKKEIKAEKKVSPKKKESAGLSIPVYGLDGKESATTELSKEIFATEINPKLLAQFVRVYLANQRQGTASTKSRGEVIGTTKKIYRQKGTGNARHGSKKAPIYVGGGIAFGPRPRDYSLKLNSKQGKKALFASLSLKVKEKNLFALSDEFLKIESKTSTVAKFLKAVGANSEKLLFILPKQERNNLILSTRNIKSITMADAVSINAYDVLRNKKIFVVKEALKVMSDHFLKNEN